MHNLKTKFHIALVSLLLPCICLSKALINEPAPSIQGKLLDGSTFTTTNIKNKIILINFWASWCEPCREEMPLMESFYQKNKQKVEIIAISLDRISDLNDVKKVAAHYSFPIALKDDVDFSVYGRIWRIPSTFVINKQGILIKDGLSGAPKIDQHFIDNILQPLINQ